MRLNLGIRRRLAPLLGNDRRKIELMNSLLFSLPGSPVIYYGDEIGMGDNIDLFDRNGVRTPMQWDSSPNAGFTLPDVPADRLYAPVIAGTEYGVQRVNVAAQRADPASLWHVIRRMIQVRKAYAVFGIGELTWAPSLTTAVAGYWRAANDQRLLVLNNLSGETQSVELDWPAATATDILTGRQLPLSTPGRLKLDLTPYQYLWLKPD